MPASARTGKAAESEKITINLGYVDLGQVDLLVGKGFYSNRSDSITTRTPERGRSIAANRQRLASLAVTHQPIPPS